jgi:uncharacterized membrane protein YedE/YeeE
MPAVFTALASGLLFGLGLTVSQMINPAKVIAFLDVFGDFDPSLAFVMATAIPVTALGYAVARRCRSPLCAPTFNPPTQAKFDRRLMLGAVLFGVGWGLVGYCPGPALAALGLGNPATVLFVGAMLIGMGTYSGLHALFSREPRHA